jgi:CRISPR type IV-associated protein Csf3
MTPIAITAHLHSGFASSDPWSPSIDGILAYHHLRERMHPDEFAVRSGRTDLMEPVDDLPLEIQRHGDWWWYACSVPMYRKYGEVRRYLHRRFDQREGEIYLQPGIRKIMTQAGPYKNARTAVQQRITDRVTWHVIGDRPEVERLLETCTHIGGRVGAGFGRVRRWSFDDGDADMARRLRPLPVEYAREHGIDGDEMYWGLRPPARLRANNTQCVMPDASRHVA